MTKKKTCRLCGEQFELKHFNEKLCSFKCKKEQHTANQKKASIVYYSKNKEEVKERKSRWNIDNNEYKRKRQRNYFENNPDKKIPNSVKVACKKYKDNIMDSNGFIYCEVCKNSNATFHVHHLIYRSEAPKHPELNNHLNLINCCAQCHHDFHSHKALRNDIVIERGLEELFDRKLIINKIL